MIALVATVAALLVAPATWSGEAGSRAESLDPTEGAGPGLAVWPRPGSAATPRPGPADTLRLGLTDAVELALERNRALQLSRLDVVEAEAGFAEARAGLFPQITSMAGFTRDVRPTDPFAGVEVGELFGAGAPTDWLLFNERARTDGDPATRPIPLDEFQRRREQAFLEAGVPPDEAAPSPFAVPNQFQANLSLSQPLYSPSAAAEARRGRLQRDASFAGLRRQLVETVDTVRQAYLGALLAREQAEVLARSVARGEAALAEAVRRVEEGVAPVTERLGAEVEVGGLRGELLQLRLQEVRSLNGLRLALGLPAGQPLALTEELVVDDDFALADVAADDAMVAALAQRSDVEELRLFVAAREAVVDAARGALRPDVNAALDLTVLGNIPDDRTRVRTSPFRPFQVEVDRRGIFSSDFWDLGVTAAIQLQWPLFQGGRLRAQVDQAEVGVRQAQVQLAELADLVRLDVEDALLEMRTARDRALLQRANAELAERNYQAVAARVRQGVAPAIERREASAQLDQARLDLAQAVHDYLAARSRFLAAIGATE